MTTDRNKPHQPTRFTAADPTENHAALFSTIEQALHTQGYSVQHGALARHLAPSLRASLETTEQGLHLPAGFQQAGIGRQGSFSTNPDIRRDNTLWLENRNPAEQAWLEFAHALRLHLNRTLFLGLFSFESHFAHYPPGGFYKKHLDAFQGQKNRMVSVVLYLNQNWLPQDGGELLLYDETSSRKNSIRVLPTMGTLVAFLSEVFPHEVLPAQRDRYSIAGWYRLNTSSTNQVDPPS
ncbi:MAG: 2OG-Fe(II) oxygenase [Limnobacter sp.]|nr:2OG-Fe(II) oxygenase [Limnobacter sp.]